MRKIDSSGKCSCRMRVELAARIRGRGRTASPAPAARFRSGPLRERRDHDAEQARRDRQIVQRPLRAAERLLERPRRSSGRCSRRRRSAAASTTCAKASPHRRRHGARGCPGAGFELLERPSRPWRPRRSGRRRPRRGQGRAAPGRSACRRDRRWRRKRRLRPSERRSFRTPPVFRGGRQTRSASPTSACRRIRLRRANSNRPNRAALSTGAGTPSSIAACSVQRPSPESETRPAKLASRGRRERGGRQVEQPGPNHAAAPPDLRHLAPRPCCTGKVGGAAASSRRRRPASSVPHRRGAEGSSLPRRPP